jgi:Flp pilus assembly protein TadG
VSRAVCQALYEASECYASPVKITENGQVVWDSDLQNLDDFAESIGINPDYF